MAHERTASHRSGFLENTATAVDGAHVRQSNQVDTGPGTKQNGESLLVDCDVGHLADGDVNEFTASGGGQDESYRQSRPLSHSYRVPYRGSDRVVNWLTAKNFISHHDPAVSTA